VVAGARICSGERRARPRAPASSGFLHRAPFCPILAAFESYGCATSIGGGCGGGDDRDRARRAHRRTAGVGRDGKTATWARSSPTAGLAGIYTHGRIEWARPRDQKATKSSPATSSAAMCSGELNAMAMAAMRGRGERGMMRKLTGRLRKAVGGLVAQEIAGDGRSSSATEARWPARSAQC
jgi:hypothetical protein